MRKTKTTVPDGDAPAQALTGSREIYDWIQCLITALIICVVTFVFFIRIIDVSGTSMNPTLNNADKMLVSDAFFKPKAGDIVVFKKDEYDPDKALVKRVIATEGQEINIDFDKGIVYVDGASIEEDYISELTTNKLDFIGPQTVPEGCVFVMGDNRNMSTDSRKTEIGMVDERLIIGKVYMVIFPLGDLGLVN
ncbi:MAG: signal peptidase I [Oscillospiraceae bacterium]|nr:signal peptidase I [Oscillospiraceae bacterium]